MSGYTPLECPLLSRPLTPYPLGNIPMHTMLLADWTPQPCRREQAERLWRREAGEAQTQRRSERERYKLLVTGGSEENE